MTKFSCCLNQWLNIFINKTSHSSSTVLFLLLSSVFLSYIGNQIGNPSRNLCEAQQNLFCTIVFLWHRALYQYYAWGKLTPMKATHPVLFFYFCDKILGKKMFAKFDNVKLIVLQFCSVFLYIEDKKKMCNKISMQCMERKSSF